MQERYGKKRKTVKCSLLSAAGSLEEKFFLCSHHVLRVFRNQKNRTWPPLSKIGLDRASQNFFWFVWRVSFLGALCCSFVSRSAQASVILEGSGRASSWRDRSSTDKAAMHAAQGIASHRIGGCMSIGGSRPHR